MLIALVGDSWGHCWTGRGPDSGTLPGIGDILESQSHTVINLSVPGSSNHQSLLRLSQLAAEPDLIIFIQTEPIRDFYTGDCDPSNSARAIVDSDRIFRMAQSFGGLEAAMRDWLARDTYSRLSTLADQFQCRLEVVGGCSCVCPDLLPSNLSSTVPSWSSLLVDSKDCLFQNSAQWLDHEYADLVRSDSKLLADWFTVSKKTLDKIRSWQQDSVYFNPDDWHPNYAGHQLLVNRLLNDTDS